MYSDMSTNTKKRIKKKKERKKESQRGNCLTA